jgi:6-phosphogluconate dehydrogenase (decarboxylating)
MQIGFIGLGKMGGNMVTRIRRDSDMPTLAAALFARFSSRGAGDYSARAVAALRNQFGGHAVKTAPRR